MEEVALVLATEKAAAPGTMNCEIMLKICRNRIKMIYNLEVSER